MKKTISFGDVISQKVLMREKENEVSILDLATAFVVLKLMSQKDFFKGPVTPIIIEHTNDFSQWLRGMDSPKEGRKLRARIKKAGYKTQFFEVPHGWTLIILNPKG